MKKTITIPQSRLRRYSSLYTREPLKIPTANFCWQWGMCARENIFVSLKAKPVLSPYRARANHFSYTGGYDLAILTFCAIMRKKL